MCAVILGYYHIIYVYIITWLVFLFFSFFLCFLALFLANKVRFASYFDFHISWGSPGKITHRRKMYEIVHAYIHMRGYMYVVYIVCWVYKQLHTQQTYI